MNTEPAILARLVERVDAINERMKLHEQEHREIANVRERGAERARMAEDKLWEGIEGLRHGHDHIIQRLTAIETRLDLSGSPITSAQRLTALEGAADVTRWVIGGLGAALAIAIAAATGLIGSIVQAIGGGPKTHGG